MDAVYKIMNSVWHEHHFVPGGDNDIERFDAVEYDNGDIFIVDMIEDRRIRVFTRAFASKMAKRFAEHFARSRRNGKPVPEL